LTDLYQNAFGQSLPDAASLTFSWTAANGRFKATPPSSPEVGLTPYNIHKK
jgi:hypothetical protein